MTVTTIACPIAMEHPEVQPEAPVWVDAAGNEYRIASGIVEGAETTEHTPAAPDRITIIVGMDGLSALAVMGLHSQEVQE